MSRPVSPGRDASGPEVLVVGAGLAGLTVGWHLAEAGLRATVLERETVPGGRSRAVHAAGIERDALAPLATAVDRELLQLVDRAGMAERMLPLRPVARAQLHRGSVVFVEPVGWLGIASLPGVPLHQALRLVRLDRLLRRFQSDLRADRPERAALLDDRSLQEFGRLYFGRGIVEHWMEPTLAEQGVEDTGDISRVAFLIRLAEQHWVAPCVFGAPLARLVEALAARVDLRLGVAAERIEPSGERFIVHSREQGRPGAQEVDALVLAVPAPEAGRLLGSAAHDFEARFLNGFHYAASVAATLALDRPLARTATRLRIPAIEKAPFLALHLVRNEPAIGGAAALLTTVARDAWSRAHLETPHETLLKELVRELGFLDPKLAGSVLDAGVASYRHAVPHFEVGRYKQLAQWQRVQADRRREGRRVYFAGDYLVGPSLEGMVLSARRAAEALIEDLAPGRPPLIR